MSSNRKRLSLLAGSSLALAGLLGGAGLILAPTPAQAAEECGSPPSGTKTCSGTHAEIDYPPTTGNLTLNLANDLVVTTGGIAASGSGSNSVTIGRTNSGSTSLDPVVTNTSGAGISVTNTTGAVTVNLTDPAFTTGPGVDVTGTTHGVRLRTGATTSSAMTFTQTNGTIEATGTGGVGLSTETTSTTGGNTTLNIGGLITGETGVQAVNNGTGAMTVNLTAPSGSVAGGQVLGGAGPALDLAPNRNLTISLGADTLVAADGQASAVIDVANVNTQMTFTNLGTLRSNDTTADGYDDLVLRVGGGAGTVSMTNGRAGTPDFCFPGFGCFPGTPAVAGDLRGRLQLSNSGATTLSLLGETTWQTAGASLLGEGATTFNHGPDAILMAATDGALTELDFGGGVNTYNQDGLLVVGGGTEAAATLSFVDLNDWVLTDTVLFGADATNTATDGVPNDSIVAEGTRLASFPGARLVMDVDLSGSQSSCDTPTAADCLVLRNGRVHSTIPLLLNDVSDGASGFSEGGLLLVDVSGTGSSEANRFVIDPATANYTVDPQFGAILDRGLYFYGLSYDEALQQHFIVGMAKQQTLQLSTLGQMAQANWRLGTGGWFDRQADLRGPMAGRGSGSGPGAWLRVVAGGTDRTIDASGPRYTYQALTGYDEKSVGLVGGVDLAAFAGEGQSYVVGLMGGYLGSDTTFKSSLTKATLKGHTLGAYAGYVAGAFFVDASVSGAWMDADYQAPGWVLAGAAEASGKLESMGGLVEAGFRLPVNEGDAYLEPLVALSHVTTDISDFALPGGTLEAEDLTSFRGSLGARVSGDLAFETFTLKMGFIGRMWEEFEGENRMIATGTGGAVPLLDDVSGTFNEIGLDLALYSNGGWSNLSVMLNAGIEFADDYKNSTGSLGFRYQW